MWWRNASFSPFITGFEWVRDDVLKYHSSITSPLIVEENMSIPLCIMSLIVPFISMFIVYVRGIHLTLPLNDFQCSLPRRLKLVPSHPNSWAMVRDFDILCSFFNIRPSVHVLMYFFQMKLIERLVGCR